MPLKVYITPIVTLDGKRVPAGFPTHRQCPGFVRSTCLANPTVNTTLWVVEAETFAPLDADSRLVDLSGPVTNFEDWIASTDANNWSTIPAGNRVKLGTEFGKVAIAPKTGDKVGSIVRQFMRAIEPSATDKSFTMTQKQSLPQTITEDFADALNTTTEWTLAQGTCTCTGTGKGSGSTHTLAVRKESAFPADHYAQADVEAVADARNTSPMVNYVDTTHYYHIWFSSSVTNLYLHESWLADYSQVLSYNTFYTMKLIRSGIYVDVEYPVGSQIIHHNNTTTTGGKPGFFINNDDPNLPRIDNFACTDATAATITISMSECVGSSGQLA